jgi:hypothetical protein
MLVDEYDVFERVAPFEPFKECLKKRTGMFELTQDILNMPDNVADIARNIYNAYKNVKPVKGEKRNLELVCASFFFASRVLNSGVLTQKKILEEVPDAREFHWAIKEVPIHLASCEMFKGLFETQGASIDDATSRMLSLVLKDIKLVKGKDLNRTLRPTIHKLKGIIYGDPVCDLITVDKINATLILMACKIHKAPMTLKRIASLLNVSEPTLLKIEKQIQLLIQKKKGVMLILLGD